MAGRTVPSVEDQVRALSDQELKREWEAARTTVRGLAEIGNFHLVDDIERWKANIRTMSNKTNDAGKRLEEMCKKHYVELEWRRRNPQSAPYSPPMESKLWLARQASSYPHALRALPSA